VELYLAGVQTGVLLAVVVAVVIVLWGDDGCSPGKT
jgi:hypothetical protein